VIQRMDFEEQITTVLNMTLFQIYRRNKNKSQSLKFSDYLKEEPYLDHYLYRVCRELETKKLDPKFRIYAKREVKKFGVFDVSALEKKRPSKTGPNVQPNPWETDLETK
jgi:hypothetical protein